MRGREGPFFTSSGYPSGAPKIWEIWSLDIKIAFHQAADCQREVISRTSEEWVTNGTHQIRKLHVPAYGSNDELAAINKALQSYLLRDEVSMAYVGATFQESSFDPRPYFPFRGSGGAVGSLTIHIDGVLGR